jgi:hypothetical protein
MEEGIGNRIVCIISTSLMILSTFFVFVLYLEPANAMTDEYYEYQQVYQDDETKVMITNYSGPGGDLVIPAMIDGKTVIWIGSYAFFFHTNITSVTIPDSVLQILDHAFAACDSLTSISLPNALESIGDYAFNGCTTLTSIDIPVTVQVIGTEAFSWCLSLGSFSIPNEVSLMGSGALSYCFSLGAIEVSPDNEYFRSEQGVLFNKDGTILRQCPGGRNGTYEVPIGVEILYQNSFAGCCYLTNLTIPEGIRTIGQYAFSSCVWLDSMTIPDSVEWVSPYAFPDCPSLKVIEVGEGNTEYDGIEGVLYEKEPRTLLRCPEGKEGNLTVPNGTEIIWYQSFEDCKSITSISIPSSTNYISNDAFWGCTSMLHMEVVKGNLNYSSVDGVLYDKNQSYLVYYPQGRQGPFVVPGSVRYIVSDGFSHCNGLTRVTIGRNVTNIGGSSGGLFDDCPALSAIEVEPGNKEFTSLDGVLYDNGIETLLRCPEGKEGSLQIPQGVKYISSRGCMNCIHLKNVTVPNSVTYIQWWSFLGCSMTELRFEGDAPDVQEGWIGTPSDDLVIYYYNGSDGFTTPTWQGINTVGLTNPNPSEENSSDFLLVGLAVGAIVAMSIGVLLIARRRRNK